METTFAERLESFPVNQETENAEKETENLGNRTEEEEERKKERAKSKSLVRKGDLIPVLAPEGREAKFWLFLCSSKCKRDGSINGKWLDRIGDTFEYRVLPIKAVTNESCMLWNDMKGRREVLMEESLEKKDASKGIYVLTTATHHVLQSLAISQIQPSPAHTVFHE